MAWSCYEVYIVLAGTLNPVNQASAGIFVAFLHLHEIDPFNGVGGCSYVPGEDVVCVHDQRGFSPTTATDQI